MSVMQVKFGDGSFRLTMFPYLNLLLTHFTVSGYQAALLVLDPTNTTKTAEYVAVATKVSTFVLLIPKESPHANNIMHTEEVTRLFVCDGFMLITHIGPIRNAPAKRATHNLTALSTKFEISLGDLPSWNSLFRKCLSCPE